MRRMLICTGWLWLAALYAHGQGPRVELRSGELWLTREGAATQLTRDGCEKGEPVWSPDRSRFAFFTNTTVNRPSCATEVVLFASDGKRLMAIPALGRGNSVNRIEWLDDGRIGIDTHMNPSSGEYRIVDVSTGKERASYFGGGFRPSPDGGQIAHAGPMPHFAPAFAHSDYVMVDNRIIYPAVATGEPNVRLPDPGDKTLYRDIRELRSDLAWSPDGKQIAFVENIFEWRADSLGSYSGAEGASRWQLVVVSAGGIAAARSTGLPQLEQGRVTVTWARPGAVEVAGGGVDQTWPIADL